MIGATEFSATAKFENGAATLKIIARTRYGRRYCTITSEVTDPKTLAALETIFEKSIKTAAPEIHTTAITETARAVVAASNRGEEL